MKITYLLCRLRPAISTMLQYWISHADSLLALKKTYRREWQEQGSGAVYLAELNIYPNGSVYEVSRLFFLDGRFQHEETWLATYGWHSNGHLIALERSCYLIFNPFSGLLYLEEWAGDDKKLEVYHELKTDL